MHLTAAFLVSQILSVLLFRLTSKLYRQLFLFLFLIPSFMVLAYCRNDACHYTPPPNFLMDALLAYQTWTRTFIKINKK